MSKRFLLLAQVFMTFFMAASMSGLMGLIVLGPTDAWLAAWPKQFLVAWPMAFVLTMILWPLSTRLSGAIMRRGGSRRAAHVADEV